MSPSCCRSHGFKLLACHTKSPCVTKDKTQSGYLATNISPNLYDVCLEGLLWEQLKLSLPDGVVDIYTQWSRIHRVETKAFGVAHCYNGVSYNTIHATSDLSFLYIT